MDIRLSSRPARPYAPRGSGRASEMGSACSTAAATAVGTSEASSLSTRLAPASFSRLGSGESPGLRLQLGRCL